MRTTLDIVDILYQALNVPIVKSVITGGVYKGKRPLNSAKEDIVIGSLPVNAEQVQEAVANVNIHVPNLKLTIGGVQDNGQPDFAKIKSVTALVTELLKEKVGSDYWFYVQQQTLFAEDEINEHYSNIRIRIHLENI